MESNTSLDWRLKLEEQIKKMDACNVVTSIGKKRIATSFINKGNYFVSTVKISNKYFETIIKEQGLSGNFLFSGSSESAIEAAELHLTIVKIATIFPKKNWDIEMKNYVDHCLTFGDILSLCLVVLPFEEGNQLLIDRADPDGIKLRNKDFNSLYVRSILIASGLNLNVPLKNSGILSKLFS
jgi:hypothetical protein